MIWTFGDSFSRHFKFLPDTWVERVASTLDQKVKSFSKPVTSLEYAFDAFNRSRKYINENDVIIVTLTNIDRRWFFKNIPLRVALQYEGEELRAYQQYTKYLTNFDIQKTYLLNFLYNLNAFSKNKHTIVMGNFMEYEKYLDSVSKDLPNIHVAKGPLSFVSDREWKREIIEHAPIEWFMKFDRRLNHLSRRNHLLLADKIIDNIKNKTPIDLNTGLATEFLTEALFNDPAYCKVELFNDEWKRTSLE